MLFRSGGNSLVIKAPAVSDANRYVKALYINGKRYDKNYVTHADVLAGGEWEFVMDSKPNKKRGISDEAKPYSLTNGEIK